MARKRIATNLHQLTVKQVQNAPEGDLTDGGGLILRIRGQSASWVLRYTAASGRAGEVMINTAGTLAISGPVSGLYGLADTGSAGDAGKKGRTRGGLAGKTRTFGGKSQHRAAFNLS